MPRTAAAEADEAGKDKVEVEFDSAKLSAARLWACQRWPYFTSGFLALQPVSQPGLGTFAVDEHWRVYIDPEALDGWSVKQAGVVLNHELQHLLRDHAGRARTLGIGRAESRVWNVAVDAEINDDLFTELSDDITASLTPVTPAHIGAESGKLAEYYYQLLLGGSIEADSDEGSGVHGLAREGELPADGDVVSASEAGRLRKAIASNVIAHAKAYGIDGGGLTRWAREQLGVSQDWRRLLAASVRRDVAVAAGHADYSYQRLSRRSGAADGVIFPAMVKPALHIAIVVDTSGSVTDDMLGHAFREISKITKSIAGRGGSVLVIACDAVAQRTSVLTGSGGSSMALVGGGGTDMREGINAALVLYPRPHAIVVLTDGYSPWPATKPAVPVTVGLLGNDDYTYAPDWATKVLIDS